MGKQGRPEWRLKGGAGEFGRVCPCVIPAGIAADGYCASAVVALLGVISCREPSLEGRGARGLAGGATESRRSTVRELGWSSEQGGAAVARLKKGKGREGR